MSVLQVPLSTISDEGATIDVETSGKALQPEGAADLSLGPVRIQGSLSGEGETYLFRGRVSGTFVGACDRCLGPAAAPFDLDALWTFERGEAADPLENLQDGERENEDGVAHLSFQDDAIDLGPAAWEEIVLAVPIKLLCKEDCAGLCPTCGTNLNDSRCNCARDADATTFTSRGLQDLGTMFPDLKPDRLED